MQLLEMLLLMKQKNMVINRSCKYYEEKQLNFGMVENP